MLLLTWAVPGFSIGEGRVLWRRGMIAKMSPYLLWNLGWLGGAMALWPPPLEPPMHQCWYFWYFWCTGLSHRIRKLLLARDPCQWGDLLPVYNLLHSSNIWPHSSRLTNIFRYEHRRNYIMTITKNININQFRIASQKIYDIFFQLYYFFCCDCECNGFCLVCARNDSI